MAEIYILIGYNKEKDEDYVVMGGGSSTKPSPKVYLDEKMAVKMAKRYKHQDSTIEAYSLDLDDCSKVS